MSEWEIETTDKYESAYKKYAKKKPNELTAVIRNLGQYITVLQEINNPLLIN